MSAKRLVLAIGGTGAQGVPVVKGLQKLTLNSFRANSYQHWHPAGTPYE